MAVNEVLREALAAKLHAIQNPMWPARWGWTEVTEASKDIYRKDAQRIIDEIVEKFQATPDAIFIDMIQWFRKNDGKADDFGRLKFVAAAEAWLDDRGVSYE